MCATGATRPIWIHSEAVSATVQVGDIIDSTGIVDYTGGPLKNKGVLRETSGRGQGAG